MKALDFLTAPETDDSGDDSAPPKIKALDFLNAKPADTLAAPKPDFSIPTPSGLTSPPQRIGGLDMSKMGQDNKLPTPGVGGQAWETLWKAPKPMEDIVDVERGSRQQQRESDTKLRAMATKAGLNPDDFAKAPGAAELVLQGSADELVDLSKMALSPGGVLTAELGTATKIPAALKRIVSLAFAAQMLKQTPEAASAFMDEMKKPPAERDYVKIGQTGAGTVASAVLGTMGLKAGVSPSKSGPMQGPLATGRVLRTPAGAQPPESPAATVTPPAPSSEPATTPETVIPAAPDPLPIPPDATASPDIHGGALEDLTPEQQAQSNAVKSKMAAEVAKVKAAQKPAAPAQEGVSETASPLQRIYQKAKDDFERARAAINAILPNIKVSLIPSGRGGKPVGGDIQISPDGKEIQISQTLLDDIKAKYPDNSEEVLKMAVGEEAIHHEHFKALGDDFESKLADIWENAPKELQDAVRKAYGGDSGMKAHHWGAELLRMAKQANSLGKITESIHWNPERQAAASKAISTLQEWSRTQPKEISDLTGKPTPSPSPSVVKPTPPVATGQTAADVEVLPPDPKTANYSRQGTALLRNGIPLNITSDSEEGAQMSVDRYNRMAVRPSVAQSKSADPIRTILGKLSNRISESQLPQSEKAALTAEITEKLNHQIMVLEKGKQEMMASKSEAAAKVANKLVQKVLERVQLPQESARPTETAKPTPPTPAEKPAAPAQEGVASVPHSEKPSEILPVRSQTPAPPRPQRNGRDTTARDSWDDQFGITRKGGRTHNDDGTPYQPTVLDEVMVDVNKEISAAKDKDEAVFRITGEYMTNGFGVRIKKMLDAGWKWDSKEKRMVNPTNPTQKASLFGKEAVAKNPTPPPSPSVVKPPVQPAQAQEGVKEPWQIPVEKFVDDNTEKKVTHRNLTAVTRQASALRARHADEVSAAVKAGKPVPPEVLADYPDLVKPSPSVVKPEGKGVGAKDAQTELAAADNITGKAANEAQKAVEAWGKHVEEVVNPLKAKIRKIQMEVGEISNDFARTKPETKGKSKLTLKSVLAKYGVASKEDLNSLYKQKNSEWANLEKQLEDAESKRKELEQVKERRGKEWSSAATRAGELRRQVYPKVKEGDVGQPASPNLEPPKPGETGPKPVQPEKVQSPIEVLNTAKQVKISAPKGATMIRATTDDGKVSVQALSNVQGENIFRGANISKIEAGTIGKDKKFVPMEGEVKVEPKTHIAGYGGSSRESIPSPETPEQLVEVQKAYTPGLDVAGTKTGLQSLLLPTAKSPEHLRAAEDLGAKLGAMHHRAEAASAQLKLGSKLFDKLGVHNERLEPGKNPGIKFMSDMSQGRPMAGKFEAISNLIEKLFAERVQKLEEAGAPLQTVRDNYFPGMWTRESRLAFNAAMEKAKLPEGFDVNTATPEQKAAIKADVDKFLADGKGSDKDMLSFFTRTPMKGKESFRKKKVFEDIMTGAEFGLRPISYNPIDLVKGKLAEMDKSIMANEFFQQQKAKGKLEVIDPYTQVPDGWVKINDKYGTIYGGPTVKIPEFVDERVYDGLLGVAEKLGVKHTRKIGIGGTRLGYSVQGGSAITTRFATETSVLAHELGHQIDYKYGLWDDLTGGGRGNAKGYPQDELRAVADIMVGKRGGKGYTHKKEEKIAQMIEAYVHAPAEMQKVAPRLFKWFDDFVKNRPELKPLSEIAPGIKLKAMTSEKYVGLPIMGYRIVPEATGDIINNYLSSSLYNNKYFGGLYKGWMAAANTLNQSQLGMGSAFHAGFTTGDVQISAGANLIKDIYGVARGNRSPAQLVDTAKTWAVSSVKTAMTGDKVLNAWRNPDGVIDPKIAQVVKAAELAGGGFKMEHGMMTEQSTKVLRDWYSSHKIKAAARSPIALTELMAKPIMEYLVPRQKAGVFAELAWRIIEQNPGKPLEELTPQFRQAWNRVDSRLGQVRYNRLFANNTAKNVVQGLVRAPGWTAGTIAEIGGAFPDSARFVKEWGKTGKLPADVPDRVAYTMSLLMTIGVINGALTYAFTGQMPRNMDFFAFRTGKKDQYGNDERFLMPSYMKDVLAYATHPLTTISNKVHPATQLLDDVLIKNHDYYGTEIRDPNASYLTQAGQTGKYVVKNFEPFWTRGARKALQQGSGVGRFIAPYFGIMPAPSYITRTKIQSEIADIYERRFGGGTKPLSKQAELQIKGEIRQAIKNGDKQKADELSKQALESGTLTQGQESALFRTANVPGDVFMWKRLDKSDKAALWAKMNAEEKLRYPMQPAGQTSNLP